MPFFRRKTDKAKPEPPAPLTVPTATPGGATVKRTPSNRSDHSPLTPNSLNGDIGVPETMLDGGVPGKKRPKSLLLQSASQQDSQTGGSVQGPASPMRTSSRLSKTLREMLHDQNGVACFLYYMKAHKAGNVIQFWLDAESFHASTVMRVRTHSLNSVACNHGNSHVSTKNIQTGSQSDSHRVQDVRSISDPSVNSGVESSVNSAVESSVNSAVESSVSSVAGCDDRVGGSSDCRGMTAGSGRDGLSQEDSVFSASDPSQRLGDPTVIPGGAGTAKSEDTGGGGKEAGVAGGSRSPDQVETSRASTGLSKEDLKEKLKKSIQHDAVTIFTKYISQDATHPIGVTEQIRNETIRRICKEDGHVDPDCFVDCQEFVFHKMGKENYSGFLDSEYHCKHQVDVLTSGKVYLADVLYNELALSYFMEFLDNEDACHLLQFWLAADNFQQHLASQGAEYNGLQAQDDAMVLYDKYFSLQATQPLGFDDKIRFMVEGNICREGGPLPDCFAKPRDVVLNTLEQFYFPGYLQSDMYYKYLSDLVSTVQTAQDIPVRPKHRRTESDASSEHSVGSQSVGPDSIKNTLLAMDTSHVKKALTRIEDDMRIDSMLLNPDELWKRPEAGAMTLGAVDDLGQFKSMFAPEPDHEKKKGSRFFKKKKDKEKEQEDMALRVAQMIINDVTTMTQTGDIYAGIVSSSPRLAPRKVPDSAIDTSKGGNS
ncbi:A-kinase anchor protein 10, mitochondrial-like [Haliotis cracherodii]|uniref:A-kinase anchor protein 10, mitochondrial-like n=1 Tax=Haliotis cracherodii TaxID=6455 RepID=UPI0039EBAD83